jgi:hypothetical protein
VPPARRAGDPGVERRRLFREFFLGLRRGFLLGRCRSCETFYLMARLCLEEGGSYLGPEEEREASSWVDAGSVADQDFGCEGACGIIPLYARLSR